MNVLRYGAFAAVMAIAGLNHAQSAKTTVGANDSQRLIGAWHLARIDVPEPDGKPTSIAQPKGQLIYTRDGHMSVQLMYPSPKPRCPISTCRTDTRHLSEATTSTK